MLIYEILERIICTSPTSPLHPLQTLPFSGVGGSGRKPIQSADPVGRVGSWRKRAPSSRSRKRAWGGLGWGADQSPGSPGCPPGDVQSATARTLPGAFRGAGRARVRPGCASGRPGDPGSDFGCHFRPSTQYFRPTLALRRARQASDPAKLIEVEGQVFGVGGSGRRPSRIRRPRPACGAVERKSS